MPEESKEDWPALSLDEMKERADLIAFVTVKDTEKQKKVMG
ncbi:hypothetical protein [Gracilibacillus salitolerans]|nr:hypothetical protein [Gracilibacillus salitolerans]